VAGATALQAVRELGGVEPGQRVLINGAAGGVGTYAVQIAKALGAEVTGVCSTRNVELVHSIGAGHVVDYTAEDFTRTGQKYDLIVNVISGRSTHDLRRALTPDGTIVFVSATLRQIVGSLLVHRFMRKKITGFMAKATKERLQFLAQLIDDGKLTPVIDRTYPLADVPEAVRYVEAGHARGKVVIAI